jgi:microcystin-dependent protein
MLSAIGTTYGAGNGSSTFNVPNFQGCFLRGVGGNSYGVGTQQQDGAPNITAGNISNTFQGSTANGAAYNSGMRGAPNSGGTNWDLIHFDASRSNSKYGSASEIRPINYAVYYYIKY